VVAVLVLAHLGAAVSVQGRSTCPSPQEVAAKLRPLLTDALRPDHPAEVAEVSPDPGGLAVTLWRADGSRAATRTVGGEHSCEELAEAAAVMIATWEDTGAARPRTLAAPELEARWSWQVGGGAGVSLAGEAVAPSAAISASAGRGGWLGVGLRGILTASRDAGLPGGSARWRRALLAVGPQAHAGWLDLHLGAGLSWVALEGRGFTAARHHDAVAAALDGAVRMAWPRTAAARGWMEVGLAFWPARTTAYEQPDQAEWTLPRFEALLTVGVSVGR
jgi:hypothetical protein